MDDAIHIACATDANYLPHCAAMLRSLASHMRDERLSIHIVHDGIGDSDRAQLESCVPVAEINWHLALPADDLATPQLAHISAATYLRLQLDRLISPEISRILYLDIDMIITGSLRELWVTDLEGKSLAAVGDAWIDPDLFGLRYNLQTGKYFNAGMLLLDLGRIRSSDAFSKTLSIIAELGETLEFSDQDALNLVFWNDWTAKDTRWNFQRIHTYGKPLRVSERVMGGLPRIIHFTESFKPWRRNEWHPYRWLYWRHLIGTPFFSTVRRKENVGLGVLARAWVKYHVLRRFHKGG